MPMTKPFHQNVVRNLRVMYRREYGHECVPLSDDLVFDTWDNNGMAPSNEEQEQWTIDELAEFMGMHRAGIDLALVA